VLRVRIGPRPEQRQIGLRRVVPAEHYRVLGVDHRDIDEPPRKNPDEPPETARVASADRGH
jgi:hypothetical protein